MIATLMPWWQFIGLLALEAGVIVGVATQLQKLRQSAAWRRTVWHVCVLSMALLMVFEFTGTARSWAGRMENVFRQVKAERIAKATKEVGFKGQGGTRKVGDGNMEHPTSNTEHRNEAAKGGDAETGLAEISLPQVSKQVAEINAALSANSSAKPITAAGSTGIDFRPFLPALPGLLWLLGITAVLGRILFARIAFEIFRWRRCKVDDENLRAMLNTLALQMGIRRKVRLLESERIYGPIAFGLLRPTIALPVGFAQKFSAAQQEAMLAHELAHLAGHDAAWYLLVDMLSAVLWWHPLVWHARNQLHAASELAADEASLLVANGPSVLAECLVEIGTRLTQRSAFRQMGVEGNGFRSGLGRRVERLIHLEGTTWCPPDFLRSSVARILGPMLLVSATIFCSAWVIPPALTKGDNMKTIHQTWKQPFAALALLASLHTTTASAQAQANPPTAPQPAIATVAAPTPPATPVAPLPPVPNVAPVAVNVTETDPHPVTVTAIAAPTPRLELTMGNKNLSLNGSQTYSEEQHAVMVKLENIFIDRVEYDGLPLTEVVNQLVEIAGKKDSAGINFVLSREKSDGPVSGSVDPTTGLPIAAPANMDWGTVTVAIKPALKHVRFIDLLEIIVKSADQPIKFSVENYGVVFSQDGPKAITTTSLPATVAPSLPMEVRTFKLGETNEAWVELIKKYYFGPTDTLDESIIRTVLVNFLGSFGLSAEKADKSLYLYFNRHSQTLMVRAPKQDMEVISTALETVLGNNAVANVDALRGRHQVGQ